MPLVTPWTMGELQMEKDILPLVATSSMSITKYVSSGNSTLSKELLKNQMHLINREALRSSVRTQVG